MIYLLDEIHSSQLFYKFDKENNILAILEEHISQYNQILSLPNFLSSPVLIFGHQEIRIPEYYFSSWSNLSWTEKAHKIIYKFRRQYQAILRQGHFAPKISELYNSPDLAYLFKKKGITNIEVLDLFDCRASLRYDMNYPIPGNEHGRYGTFIDIGCLEHLFDTKQCLENCLNMVRLGGHYMLQVPVSGYFAHGLHVFNPEGILSAIELNGFQLIYKKYSKAKGKELKRPLPQKDTLMWIVAKRIKIQSDFQNPQQNYWKDYYAETKVTARRKIQEDYWSKVG